MSQHYALRYWQGVQDSLVAALKLVPDEKLDQSLAGELPVIGDLTRYMVAFEEGMLNLLQHQPEPWPAYTADDLPTVSAILDKLDEVHRETAAYYNTLTNAQYVAPEYIPERDEQWIPRDVLYGLLELNVQVRGMLYALMRLAGLEPPLPAIESKAP